mmetsp:Transcript_89252/g.178382  ORF Transcript_89252/g.178382 Transcript_89252/m.178382 type:complete len:174 (+) Transcript_89252:114-635(+)|eukprot:CAMPEP_0171646852 /NCGR_PEP_ID=MMETSP0990-20121206/35055_1 /TAXON_ID=483369 /ORGANISM="non described non described, Strain CCMP2098" /LENGTH=173 /DNA_ID=CAMNT_0012223859 /DNA_START=92 /DNA_END=613 /DNA_ORIENTATION=+
MSTSGDKRDMHPHEMVAAALGGPGSMLNGGAQAVPGGEELETVTRIFAAHHEFFMIIVPLVITYFILMRCFFGTWSIASASTLYKSGERFEDRYDMAFERRAQITYQINWAKSRGDEDSCTTLRTQLADIELEITNLESDNSEPSRDDGDRVNLPGSDKLRRRGAALKPPNDP